MIELAPKSKVKVHLNVHSYMYSDETLNEIQIAFANKYNIPKEKVTVIPEFIVEDGHDENEIITSITSDNIQDPQFQKKLFEEYLRINKIEDYDWEYIEALDNDFNDKINYHSYDKYRKFAIKWIKWSNFLSYGTGNSFDFSELNGLVLLNGEPANRSGKTAFAVDLIHFWLFGKATSDRNRTLSQFFNNMLPEETEMKVEGCLNIEGEDYIIKRTVTRPQLKNRKDNSKVSQKVEYYKVVGNNLENLYDYEDLNGENPHETNKIIKECIGRQEDFDLMMCVTESNVDELTIKTATERGKLFLGWIGLLPIEEKFELANNKFNEEIKPKLLSNIYNREDLKKEIIDSEKTIEEQSKAVLEIDKACQKFESELEMLDVKKNNELSKKNRVDDDIMKLDIKAFEIEFNKKYQEGVTNKSLIDSLNKEIDDIGDIDFSMDEFNNLNETNNKLSSRFGTIKEKIESLKALIENLKKGEYCPTCGAKLKNVDNSELISEKQQELEDLVKEKSECEENIKRVNNEIESRNEMHQKYVKINEKKNRKIALEAKNSILRETCLQMKETKKKYLENKEAIDQNARIDSQINLLDANIKSIRLAKERKIEEKSSYVNGIKNNQDIIKRNNKVIGKMNEQEIEVRNYKIYLDMIGKNGISKMVLRNALPIINGRIKKKLDGVCDFDINIEINQRNEVTINIINNGIKDDIKSGSGFERTVAALVLRNVLAEISTIPKMNFVILDEILGRVASENHDKIKLLYDRIVEDYDFVFHITHNSDVLDWHNQIVTVVKPDDGCSRLNKTININTIDVNDKKSISKREKTKKNKTTKK